MNASLWRSAHSAIIYEGKDSAVALMDEHGNMLGQSTGVPLFIGAIDVCVRYVKDYYGDDIGEGDIFIMNDSYMQGTHLHDVTAVGPIFFEVRIDRLWCGPRPLERHRRHRSGFGPWDRRISIRKVSGSVRHGSSGPASRFANGMITSG